MESDFSDYSDSGSEYVPSCDGNESDSSGQNAPAITDQPPPQTAPAIADLPPRQTAPALTDLPPRQTAPAVTDLPPPRTEDAITDLRLPHTAPAIADLPPPQTEPAITDLRPPHTAPAIADLPPPETVPAIADVPTPETMPAIAELNPSTRSRKRARNEKHWKINERKTKRNSGMEYISKKGVTVPGKAFTNNDCGCPKKCFQQFQECERKVIHDSFWKLGDYTAQNSHLYALVKSSAVSRKRPRDGSGATKNVVYKYFLKHGEKSVVVCKKYFLETFKISNGRLYRCVSKKELSECKEQRGTTGSRQMDDSDIVEHIHSFPAYQSHYSRIKNPNRKYLNSDLTVKKMYDLYKQYCTERNLEPKKLKYYYNVFNSKFNLHFKPPHKDTCKSCDEFELKLKVAENDDIKRQILVQKELHQRKADSARDSLRADSQKLKEAYVMTFDLQKALAYPKLTVSIAYYKRNLYLYNFGIHCFNDNTGYMYAWDETEGGRGSQDIATCLIKHLKLKAATERHIIAYSDSCTGQNRNIKLSLSFMKLVQDPAATIEIIDIKFLVSGHSYLPNDGEFGIIENKSRKYGTIYTPQQWLEIIRNAKEKEPRFQLTEMKREEFVSTENLENAITNRKKTICGYKLNWLKIRWLRFERRHPLQFKFKETLGDVTDFYTVDLSRRKTGRPTNLHTIPQEPLYPSRRVLTAAKKNDMMDLLPYIPPIHHPYFRNLRSENNNRSSTATVEEERLSDDEIVFN